LRRASRARFSNSTRNSSGFRAASRPLVDAGAE
jgi:hypothetical protein